MQPRSCGALAFTALDVSNVGKAHFFAIPLLWPHQHRPSALMMQVPVPQHLGSSLIHVFQGLTVGLAIGTTVVGDGMVVKLHIGASQGAVLGGAALHAHAPQPK